MNITNNSLCNNISTKGVEIGETAGTPFSTPFRHLSSAAGNIGGSSSFVHRPIAVPKLLQDKPPNREISTVLNLRKIPKAAKSSTSAFSVVSKSTGVLEAVNAFKNLSLSNKVLGVETNTSSALNTLMQSRESSGVPKSYLSMKCLNQAQSRDSLKSLSTLSSSINISLPDGAEASDINGFRAFEDLSEVSEVSKLSSNSVSAPKKQRSTTLRKDVVWKGILRGMKKYYAKEFKSYFNYSDQKFIKKPDCKQTALSQANQFLGENSNQEIPNQAGHFLIALIDLKGRLYEEMIEFPGIDGKISDLLRYFTSNKLKDLLRFHQFSSLILHFLSKEEEIESLASKSQSSEANRKAYRRFAYSLRTLVNSYL